MIDDPTPDPIHEAARQAAREAVARRHEKADRWFYADEIRACEHDDDQDVADALTGADAALDTILPLIRDQVLREAAAVAVARETALGREATLTTGSDRDYARAREDEAATIKRAILVLVERGADLEEATDA